MDLAAGEQVFFHGHPAWWSMLRFHLRGLIAAILVGVLAGLASAAASGAVQAGWVVAAVLFVFVLAGCVSLLRSRRVTYTITSRRLTIETGLVARDVHETRLEQIQNVSVSQSLVERVLDIGTVSFDTAGGAAFEFSFAGIARPRDLLRTVDRALHERLAAGRVGPGSAWARGERSGSAWDQRSASAWDERSGSAYWRS